MLATRIIGIQLEVICLTSWSNIKSRTVHGNRTEMEVV